MSWLGISVPRRRNFERTPLQLALCQIRHSIVLDVQDPSSVASFHEKIRTDYPVMHSTEHLVGEVQVSTPGASGKAAPPSATIHRFADLEDQWTVVAATDFLALETRNYEGFDSFLRRLESVIDASASSFDPPVATRIGLRYVNELRSPEEKWDEIVKPEVLGVMTVPEIAVNASRSVNQIFLEDSTGLQLQYRHGAFRDGTSVPPRDDTEVPTGSYYLVDIDAFREFDRPNWEQFETHSILPVVDNLHEAASTIFRWSLTESYLDSLGDTSND